MFLLPKEHRVKSNVLNFEKDIICNFVVKYGIDINDTYSNLRQGNVFNFEGKSYIFNLFSYFLFFFWLKKGVFDVGSSTPCHVTVIDNTTCIIQVLLGYHSNRFSQKYFSIESLFSLSYLNIIFSLFLYSYFNPTLIFLNSFL